MFLGPSKRSNRAVFESVAPPAAASTPMQALISLPRNILRRVPHPALQLAVLARPRSLACAGQITNRNPRDYTPEDRSLESATFGTDEFSKQQ
jgi:hypothetical protein